MINPNLSIIIVSFNTSELTLNCLRSVLADKGLEFDLGSTTISAKIPTEIIVVDNASTDESVSKITNFKKSLRASVKLITNKTNLGFATANNQGMAVAKGNYFLLLNSDTLIKHSSVSMALKWLSAHPKVGVCSAQLLNADGSIQASGGTFPNLANVLTWSLMLDDLPLVNTFVKPLHPHTPSFYTHDKTYTKSHQQDWITGAFMLLRSQVFQKTGGFDEHFFMYAEELEWCYRIRKAGFTIWYITDPQITHFGGKSTPNQQAQIAGEYRGLLRFFKLHHPKLLFPIKVTLHLNAILRVGFYTFIRHNLSLAKLYAQNLFNF